jgi:hypothetical protein
MKTHRQLFAANQLLQKKKALPKVLELRKRRSAESKQVSMRRIRRGRF